MKEMSVSPLLGPTPITQSSSVELPESKTTELDEEQVVCKNPTDFNVEAISKPYYNANPPSSMDTTSTVALAYSLEIQSRLQHLESLLGPKSVETDAFLIDGVGPSPHKMESAHDMMGGIHSNNMKLIEGIIERVMDEHSRSDPGNAERDRHFYSKLYDTAPSKSPNDLYPHPPPHSNAQSQSVNEWSQPLPRKRRPSVEEKAYKFFDRSARSLYLDAMQYIESLEAQSHGQHDAVAVMTSAVMLYSCGALYFCVEQQATVSLVSFLSGLVLITVVMVIGILFERSSSTRDWNTFVVAIVLSLVMCYIAVIWISSMFNVSAAAILLLAVLLSFEYGHGPISAKERNLEEIWICLLFNCGLPLFSYFMQCPELVALPQTEGEMLEAVTTETATAMMQEMESVTLSEVEVNALSMSSSSTLSMGDTVTVSTTMEVMEQWLMWMASTLYHFASVIVSDFWNMLDVTYALEADVVNRLQIESQIVSALQQRAQEMANEFGVAATSAIAEAVSTRNKMDIEMESKQTVTSSTMKMAEGGMEGMESMDIKADDDRVYWFNSLFHLFPAPLFHAVLVSWFMTHSTLLIRNVALYHAESTKLLYCAEIALSYVVSGVFWCYGEFDSTLFALQLLTTPWTVGLLRAIWEHGDLVNDERISRHVTVYNVWYFMMMFVSICWNWTVQTGLFWSLFSPNALVVAVPLLLIMHSMPMVIDEVVWATDF